LTKDENPTRRIAAALHMQGDAVETGALD